MMQEYNKYLNVIWAECVATFDKALLEVGKKYRLGIRFNTILNKEVYYVLEVKDGFGTPIYVEIESEYFVKEELSSISFIMS